MAQGSRARRRRKWHASAHASLCRLGFYLCLTGFFRPLQQGVRLKQQVLKSSPAQQVELVFVSLLVGAQAIVQTGTTRRVDPALQAAFGLAGCAAQAVLADTLDAATEQDVADLQRVVEASFEQHSQARRHDRTRAVLVLDRDLSPVPASRQAEGSERCYLGRCRSKTGHKLVRVRASPSQETVWEELPPGRTVETLAVLQQALAAAERRLDLEGDRPEAAARRARVEWRLDSGGGRQARIAWRLARGYQVTGKFKSTARVTKLVGPITTGEPPASPGRELAAVPAPVALARPGAQSAVRTPCTDKPSGYEHAVLFSSRTQLGRQT